MACDSYDLIMYITTGNQTQSKVYADKSCHTSLDNVKLKESKAIQVDSFEIKNTKHSQLQTVSIVTRDTQVQVDGVHYSPESGEYSGFLEDGVSGLSNIRRESFVYDNASEKQIESNLDNNSIELKVKSLLRNLAELEDQNVYFIHAY